MPHRADADTTLATLGNGVRVVTMRTPQVDTASISVYVRTGSAHETRALNGVSHFVEHMVFKGTRERDARRVNLDAERLGADVNAHTDKDHTAFHMRGLARHAPLLLRMLGDVVQHPTFPADEIERERQVLLQEYTEDDEDPMSTAFKLFDKACFGLHPVAQPVIGTRRNIERFGRADLVDYVQRQYGAANVVVGVAGNVDADAMLKEAEAIFGAMPRGNANTVEPPVYAGDIRSKPQDGSSQTHVVLGFPIPSLRDDDAAATVAATLFGEGMSSPLMDELRERRGLVYYAACSADLYDTHGQFVVEASTSPGQLDEFLREAMRLLAGHAASIAPVDLERARNQLMVRRLHALQKPSRRLEYAALDLYALGRLRPRDEWMQRIADVDADAVRGAFARMLRAGASAAMAGKVSRGASERAREILSGLEPEPKRRATAASRRRLGAGRTPRRG